MQNLEKYLSQNSWKADWEETKTHLLNLWGRNASKPASRNRTNLKVGCLEMNTFHNIVKDTISYESLVQIIAQLAKSQELDVLLCPEWLFLTNKLCTREEKEKIIKDIAELTSTTDCLIIPGTIVWQDNGKVRNSASVLYKGNVLKEYTKYKDGGDIQLAYMSSLEAEFGPEMGTSFNWKGLKIGMEICADHGFGCIANNTKIKRLDLQIVISCGLSFYDRNLIKLRNGGYGVLCDGRSPRSAVIKKGLLGGKYETATQTDVFPEDQLNLPITTQPKFSIYHLGL